jgi:hypothetical protein
VLGYRCVKNSTMYCSKKPAKEVAGITCKETTWVGCKFCQTLVESMNAAAAANQKAAKK